MEKDLYQAIQLAKHFAKTKNYRKMRNRIRKIVELSDMLGVVVPEFEATDGCPYCIEDVILNRKEIG